VLTSPAEILQIRADLEGYAARLAAEKLSTAGKGALADELAALEALAIDSADDRELVAEGTNAWHRSIRMAADNAFLERFLDMLAPFDRTIRVKSTLDPVEWALDREEHRQIMAAILAGDGDAAERVMHEHIHRVIAFHARSSAAPPASRRAEGRGSRAAGG
jgi:DNA-binding GntR family transcriptional regulator